MNPTIVFPCGHSHDLSNLRSILNPRCATCARDAEARRGKAAVTRPGPRHRNETEYSGRFHNPHLGLSGFEGMEAGSRRLLIALYRQHPYVFDAAERSGRRVVRP
ncbi:hypothetical protein [Novosphingobium sp. ZW T3_23]|uniref:hypothetical protein n=1 Tax=Novosphingobium sp. ZW T3_23 TaxID=3378084 RepID=UPI0038537E6C